MLSRLSLFTATISFKGLHNARCTCNGAMAASSGVRTATQFAAVPQSLMAYRGTDSPAAIVQQFICTCVGRVLPADTSTCILDAKKAAIG